MSTRSRAPVRKLLVRRLNTAASTGFLECGQHINPLRASAEAAALFASAKVMAQRRAAVFTYSRCSTIRHQAGGRKRRLQSGPSPGATAGAMLPLIAIIIGRCRCPTPPVANSCGAKMDSMMWSSCSTTISHRASAIVAALFSCMWRAPDFCRPRDALLCVALI